MEDMHDILEGFSTADAVIPPHRIFDDKTGKAGTFSRLELHGFLVSNRNPLRRPLSKGPKYLTKVT